MKKILLTGATGYLGKNLLKGLLKEGHEVIALVRESSDVRYITALAAELKIYTIGITPLRDIFSENQIDTVIHTAANYGRKGEALETVIHANLGFPLMILEQAIKNDVRYFINTDTSLPKALNWYSRSKKQFLEWLEVCSAEIKVLNLQLEYFYGPNDDHSKFVTYVLKELISGKDHIDFTAATPYRDFIYIDDVVRAYLLLLSELENFEGLTTVEVGSGTAIMLKDIIQQIQEATGQIEVKLNFGALPMRENEIMHSCANTDFLESKGWKPEYTFKEGIQKTINIENNQL
ncbi:NAD-dependent epimerase/dehydratase family protein [Pedobacter metabolipauper]|uniref:Nucleoside-diphosphate-sugar epimerase n=1 Tax=Pedobacter metabolipauper TaxID=425513 RepID=A0A4V3D1B0_9SPHI|nr:NAD(P)-dependent oxidoreductase [Pedobacter metabolipauper]TDQ09957.1 nucleoside-diphosphate-sugar epimerase [Pedobacter metabolipauper]